MRSRAQSLDAEAGAAAAGGFDLGVFELEAGGFEGLDVVHRAAVQVHGAGGVDEDLKVFEADDLVHHAGGVLKGHRILEAGAASTDDADAQTGGDGVLGGHDFLDLGDGGGGEHHGRAGGRRRVDDFYGGLDVRGGDGGCHGLDLLRAQAVSRTGQVVY